MGKLNKIEIEKAASILKQQHENPRTDSFLKFLATLDLFTRFLDLEYTSKEATRSGFNVLNTLVLFGGSMSPTEISKEIFRSKNAIGHVVTTLESHGLVTTVQANNDRRSIQVQITEKGLALTEKESILARERIGQRAFNMLSDDELATLHDILGKIMERTQDLVDELD